MLITLYGGPQDGKKIEFDYSWLFDSNRQRSLIYVLSEPRHKSLIELSKISINDILYKKLVYKLNYETGRYEYAG